ncbi:Rne/Rng family ribonuclease [bacterium]|nr:Rne/Rng family ribonuclease [bacterium]
MGKSIIINAEVDETRIALLENGLLFELHIERKREQGIVGNIYKGTVTRVLPGIQAAFVDVGLEKDVFLYVMDVHDNIEEFEKLLCDKRENGNNHPNSYDKSVELEEYRGIKNKGSGSPSRFSIEEILSEGQDVLVQISKEPIGSKGARATTHISLPGRFLVLLPTINHIGISKRISDEGKRTKLRNILNEIKSPNLGLIARTASEDKNKEDFIADLFIQENLWNKILKESDKKNSHGLLHKELDPTYRTVRDLFTNDVDELIIDSDAEYIRCLDFVQRMQPHLTHKVKLHIKDTPIFDEYNIEAEIRKAMRKKVWLKSGGYLVIDQTEALVVVDVNTGRFVGKKDFEETILKTNLEAAKELIRQLRLRDLGGIIIVDFIDMESEINRKKVIEALQSHLKSDRAKTSLFQITELGLVQMTRKRARESLENILCEPCPYCTGHGFIKSKITVSSEINREIRRLADSIEQEEIIIRANPELAVFLHTEEKDMIRELEHTFRKKIIIKSDDNLHQEQFDIVCF